MNNGKLSMYLGRMREEKMDIGKLSMSLGRMRAEKMNNGMLSIFLGPSVGVRVSARESSRSS
ncbi:hypothetical protein [Trichococcus flocculiformis]|uniref:hypothetical protein n=1 Tax=Trichococcus flocculiformis TaxID=82803 RepID=UPI003DA28A5D